MAVIKNSRPIVKNGQPHTQLFLRLSQDVLDKYGLDEDKFEIPTVFVKSYPSGDIYNLGNNTLNPLFLCFTNFDGTRTIDSEIQSISERLRQKSDELNTAYSENEAIRIKMKELIEQLVEYTSMEEKHG